MSVTAGGAAALLGGQVLNRSERSEQAAPTHRGCPAAAAASDEQLSEGEGQRPAGDPHHLDCDGSVHRFTVLFEEQLQPLSGHTRLPAAGHRHTCV